MNPIFTEEIEKLDDFLDNSQNYYDCMQCNGQINQSKLESFLLASLQRVSMQVVEEVIGEKEIEGGIGIPLGSAPIVRNEFRSQTLAKAQEIIGIKEE